MAERKSAIVRNSLLVLLSLLCACSSPPEAPPRSAIPPGPGGGFDAVLAGVKSRHGEDASGFVLLEKNEDALHWRLALIDSARRSLDIRYHLWDGKDDAGLLLAERILAAAERGVRVRVLVDDLKLIGRQSRLATIDRLPSISIRVLNPWRGRGLGSVTRPLEFIGRKNRRNHRTHNKLMVADNQVAIVGGRNLGEHYFGLSDDFVFHDLDVILAGPAVPRVSGVFDDLWNSEWAMPGSEFGEGMSEEAWDEAVAEARERLKESPRIERFGVSPADWTEMLAALPRHMAGGSAEVLVDEGESAESDPRAGLLAVFGSARSEILVANAFLIPGSVECDLVRQLTENGVTVRILLNSLGPNDVPVVNDAYRESRRALIEAGAELYELRPDAALKSLQETPPASAGFVGLHKKTLVIDRKRVYLGSLELDRGSGGLDTDMGLLIDSPRLAEAAARGLEREMHPENSWRVTVSDEGRLTWRAGEKQALDQPARSCWHRIRDDVYSILPIEDHL